MINVEIVNVLLALLVRVALNLNLNVRKCLIIVVEV
jgi:hypothetical protein